MKLTFLPRRISAPCSLRGKYIANLLCNARGSPSIFEASPFAYHVMAISLKPGIKSWLDIYDTHLNSQSSL